MRAGNRRVHFRQSLGATVVAICLAISFQGCAEVPITHRSALHLVPENELLSMSLQQYDDVLQKSKLSTDTRDVEMVRRVGNRIAEADRIGLTLMARAGYDPRQAIPFWERMSKLEGKSRPPEFLSTHPAPETRIADIKKYIPEALPYYEESLK